MSKANILRSLVNQRLTAAAEEIFKLFERTIAEYEEELSRSKESQHKPLDPVINPEEEIHKPDIQQLRRPEVLPQQQERGFCLNQKNPPEPACIKEEGEELWSSQERDQHPGAEEADSSVFTFTSVQLKWEAEDGEKAQSSQLHGKRSEMNSETEHLKTEADGEDCGGSERDRDFNPDGFLQPVTADETLHLIGSDTDDSGDWVDGDELQKGLNHLQNKHLTVNYVKCNTGSTSFGFSECPSIFGPKQKHDRVQTGEKPFICSICAKRYPSKKLLQMHMRRHSVVKPYSCSVCKKSFIRKEEMVRHMRTHTGEKPFSCPICGRRFTQRGSLKSHSIIHTGEKPYGCNLCGRRFTWLKSVKIHKCIKK
ncbi:zinc finger protein 2 homolog [Cheilinus undulatus]|uniref:zinc finger protein 2 homolog n=1 Tax=Cheilinus undulatus TaxID=241271 RepID=UPI001BD29B83|nr:zinc finger protein 2 homolog [Cheilinus undulatus]